MRIVQAIETSGPGGAEQMLIQLSARLAERGHEVRALLLRDGWLRESLADQGTSVTVLPLSRPLDWRFARELSGFLRAHSIDLFHSHEITFAFYGRWAASRTGAAHVATAHGKGFSRRVKRRLIGSIFTRWGRSFQLVAVSDATAREISRRFLLPRRRVSVIANGIPLPDAVGVDRGPGDETLRIVSVGNLYPVKNHALTIEAVSRLRQRGISAELDILGRGKEEASLSQLVHRRGLADAVRLQGFRDDVDSFLSKAHVFVSSSHSEGLPVSFLEAMAHELPVVASRVGGVPEIVRHEVDGLHFEPGSVDGLVAALIRLARDEALRRRLGCAAASKVHAEYSVDTMVDKYLELYERLVGCPEPGRERS